MKLRATLVMILTIMSGIVAGQDQVSKISHDADKFSVENCLNQFNPDKTVKTTVGYQYWFIPQKFLADGLTVKMSVVGPNQATHAPHSHTEAEIFFILEGTARVFLNGKSTTGAAYSSFYCPENSEHGISNAGNTELKYLVIRKYPLN